MVNIEQPNKLSAGVIIAAVIIGGLLYWDSNDDIGNQRIISAKIPPTTISDNASVNFREAPNHIGEYVIIDGMIDGVFTSNNGTNFFNFCPNYKTCPFSAVIFESDVYKFSNLRVYENKNVEISGIITTYQGRAQIIIKSPSQIKLK